jgi:hypothetical protein
VVTTGDPSAEEQYPGLNEAVAQAVREALAAGALAAPLEAPPAPALTMVVTPKLGLKQPALDDPALVTDLNDNMTILDNAVTATSVATLTNKTLTAPIITNPTITGWTNAQHSHVGAAGGGSLDGGAIVSGDIGTGFVVRETYVQNYLNAGPDLVDATVRDTLWWGPIGAGAEDVSLKRTAAGVLAFGSPSASAFLEIGGFNAVNRMRLGQPVPAASGTWITGNARYDTAATNWKRDDLTKAAFSFNTGGTDYLIYSAKAAADPITWVSRLQMTDAGLFTLTADASAGIGLTVDQGGIMVSHGGALNLANPAQSLSAGWAVSAANTLNYIINGAATGSSFTGNGSLLVSGTMDSRPGAEGLAGSWLLDNVGAGARRAFVGTDGGAGNSWRVYTNIAPQGDKLTVNLSTGLVSASGQFAANQITSNTTFVGQGAVCSLSGPANIQLGPAGGYVHPDANAVRNLGHPTLNWNLLYANGVTAPAQLNLTSGFHLILTSTAGGWIYSRSTGHHFFDGSAGALVAPEIDNKLICGGTGNRWQYVAAASGSINTCRSEEKAILGLVVPAEALDAVLHTPIHLFHPKDGEGNVDEAVTFAGQVDTDCDSRLQIAKGSWTSPNHQASYAMASIQALHQQIVGLRAEVAQLKEALAA